MFSAARLAARSDAMPVRRDISVRWKSSSCFAVGVCHLALLGCSLYERIWELIKLEEPFLLQDHIVVLASHVAQVLSILLLIFGSVTGNSNYILPWLICTAPLFLSGTLYAILYVSQEETSQMLLNFVVVGIIWTTWYVVVKFHLENRMKAR